MTRRVFILATIGAGTALVFLPQENKTHIRIEPFRVMQAVQEVLFPKGLQAPSALEFGATNYLLRVSSHSSFMKSDLKFLTFGADLFINEVPNFFKMNAQEKEKALRNFVEGNSKGENWISLLLFYTLEALLSDPIYGGNRNEIGWKWLSHNAGQPQPKTQWVQSM